MATKDSSKPTEDPIKIIDELIRSLDLAVGNGDKSCGGWLVEVIMSWWENSLRKRLVHLRQLLVERRFSMQEKPDDDELPDFYVVDFGNGEKEVTRSRLRVFSTSGMEHLPLTRRDLYRGRWAAAECEYAHSFMCGGFPIGKDPDRPSKDEWLDMKPYPFEVDKFLSEKLFPRT